MWLLLQPSQQPDERILLESAVFLLHITATTLRIIGSLRAACTDPVERFLACPFS